MKDWETYVQTSLSEIAKKAKTQPEYRFRNLYGMLDERLTGDSWQGIKKAAASGVDRISARDFGEELEGNIRELVEDLKGSGIARSWFDGGIYRRDRENCGRWGY